MSIDSNRQLVDNRWLYVDECPGCGRVDEVGGETLYAEKYWLGDEIIPTLEHKIKLIRCRNCRLLYKNVVPAPQFLAEVFARQAGKVWADNYGNYGFADEAGFIQGLMGNKPFDVLDIGASNGSLLKAIELEGTGGRRSALDVVVHPGVEQWVRGEFIHGLADNDNLSWSGEPYNIVTMFDVVEHLYDPNQTFSNLRHLVEPGGFVVIETGNPDSFWPRKFGSNRWWYTCLFEHHIFWSRPSIEYMADKHGFQVSGFQNKRHKSRSALPLSYYLPLTAMAMLYRLTPTGYSKAGKAIGNHSRVAKVVGNKAIIQRLRAGVQPWSPFTQDHFRVVLRKRRVKC